MIKTTFQKDEPKTLIYRDFRKLTNTNFQHELIRNLNSRNLDEYCIIEKSFIEALEKHAPKKRKILRNNQKPHVNETLRSAIMKSCQLKNKAMKSNLKSAK